MGKSIGSVAFLLAVCAMMAPPAAFAWSVTKLIDRPDETRYVIKCDNGATATVKQIHANDPKLMYMNGWWLVEGGSYFNYSSQEAAVKAACAAAKESK